MIRLVIHTGPLAGREITTAASTIRIGRDPSKNDLVLEGDEQVSSRHCLVQRSPRGTYVLEDLGSTNGTLINGRKIANLGRPVAVYLSAGDRFQIGKSEVEIADGKARVTVIEGPRAGRVLELDDRLLTIGRAPDNLLELEDGEASGYHAVIRPLPLGFVLEDQGSTNGCLVNGAKVTSHLLSDGDEIAIGKSRLRFLVDDLEASGPAASSSAIAMAAEGESPARLVAVGGPQIGRTIELGDGQVVLGRRPDATLQLVDDLVSGVHCAITRVDEGYVLVDLGSRNGTFINGTRIAQGTPLGPGDLITVGESVFELRLTGGAHGAIASQVARAMATHIARTQAPAAPSVLADGAYQVQAASKFVVAGHVIASGRVAIGRSPAADLRIEGVGVSKDHCRIVWSEGGTDGAGFWLEDTSTHGTYLNDRRVVRERLAAEQVVRVGPHLINVGVRGDHCTVEPIDAVQALAAIEVAREEARGLVAANLQAAAGPQVGYGALGGGYKTVFQLPVADTDALVRERKEKFVKRAPAWRPSTDIAPQRIGKVAVASGVVTAVALAAFLVFTSDASALMNHPLGEAHASAAFATQARERGLGEGCTSCHTVGDGVDEDKCAACHPEARAKLRGGHAIAAAAGDGRARPGAACSTCHLEHRASPRFVAVEARTDGSSEAGVGTPAASPSGRGGTPRTIDVPSHLGATASCTSAGCHPDQHSVEFLRQGSPPPSVIAAGPVPDFRLPQRELHAAHAVVESGGKSIAIGCTACHATTTASGALAPSPAGQSCFRCHQGGEQHVAGQCSACHDDEHRGAAALVRLPPGDPGIAPAAPPPTAGRSLLRGGPLALAAFLPLLLFAGLQRWRRRERTVAAVAELRSHPVEMVKRLIHSINNDKCVGCAMCVQACPASVLELVNHKSRVVNFDACIQCKKCEEACAFDALRMHEADKPPPMVSMPEVDANYETPIAGMYLIGQAAGTPQVKNASNLGRAVVQHAFAGGLRPGGGAAVGAAYDVVIAGSGPAGLSAALSCRELGLRYLLLEKERETSWTIRSYYHKGKPVMAEPHEVELVGLLPHWDTNREELLAAWDGLVASQGVEIRFGHQLASVAKEGERFVLKVTDKGGAPLPDLTAARVVLAIGTMGNPRKLGCPGEDLPKVKNALVDPDEWRGKNILVVGGTDSAIEVVMALCEHNKVWLSGRGAKFDRVKPKNLKLIEDAFAAGTCTPLWATAVKEVTDGAATLEHKADGRLETLPNDVVFAMIGGNPPIKWLQSVGVNYVDKPHSWSPPRTDELARQHGALPPKR